MPLAEKWNGTAWSVQEPPSPTGAKSSLLAGVSCTSSTACIAAGYFNNSSGTYLPLAEKWNGTTWSIQEIALPIGGKYGVLGSVSCASSTACVAVAYFENSAGKTVPLSERWNGTTWSAQELPSPTKAQYSVLYGVSCAASTECVATGYYENGPEEPVPLAEAWNGTTWAVQEPPIPAGAKYTILGGVSCTSDTECASVGYFKNSTLKFVSLAERYL